MESGWRLEAEVPEIIIVSEAVEGTFVDLDDESRYEQALEKRKRDARRECDSSGIRRNTGVCEKQRVRNMRKRKRGLSCRAR